jgi:DNA-binding MarR family transcriptional regulator
METPIEDLSPQALFPPSSGLRIEQAEQQGFLRTIEALEKAHQALMVYRQEGLRPLGLTLPQYQVLTVLGRHLQGVGEGSTNGSDLTQATPQITSQITPQTITQITLGMGELAQAVGLSKGTLTGIIDRLEAKNLVQRSTPSDNRRRVRVSLTPTGQALFQTVFPAQVNHLKQCFDRLNPADLELLRVLLNQLHNTLSSK